MVESTETESKETLDGFIDSMVAIAETKSDPKLVQEAPHTTIVKRIDNSSTKAYFKL
ncbi:glycine cleavage system protein P-like pyridoxal-binding family [Virgibacillus natechei]|uniref:Glycine cleavage system protein P-like pyridoxal-binding family n=1 Tax=Virgibacillus natechei TaxID=1216297 RepID=A0ABS4IFM2_9BACI|nr:glycine cleavage system protein P-like pyridoxal-binding family [Virgibacillus natechei]